MQSTKAALLSGLVFPGVGHLYLRRYVRGILIAGGAGVLLYFVVSVTMHTALAVIGNIQSGNVSPTVESISTLVSKQSQGNEGAMNIAMMALIALWLIGIVDSYREGRAREQGGDISNKGESELP
jgi:hypothetical protein